MSKADFSGKQTYTTGHALTASDLNSWQDGVQDELEERFQSSQMVAGVISGFAVTTSDANSIAIATGDAYAAGKRYSGSGAVDFSASDAADTYYIVVDSSDEATPYDKTTTEPDSDSEDLVLASVAWDGTTTLSSLADLRRWGVQQARIECFDQATVVTGTLFFAVLDRDMWIDDVQIVCTDNGSAGTTTVDVHAGAAGASIASIFTTQANRPQLLHGDTDRTVDTSGVPEVSRKLSAGDIIEVVVDEAATGAQNLAVLIRGRYY